MARQSRLALAAAAFALAATVAYLVQRLADRIRSGAPDVQQMIAQVHVAFYWRAATAVFWGGLAAIAMYALAARLGSAERPMRALAIASVPIGILHLTLSWLFP